VNKKNINRRSPKRQYRIRNWPDYNAALVARGSLTFWVDEHSLATWLEPTPTNQPGRPFTYSDMAVQCMALLSCVYRLPLRSTQGLLHSVLQLMGLSLPTPHYSTLCRRRQKLQVMLPLRSKTEPLHVVVDSTGLKLFGEGEWKVRMHGWSRHRTWLRLHIGVDEATGEVRAAQLTPRHQGDKEMLPHLLQQVSMPIAQVSGDGGYDFMSCYDAIEDVDAHATISLRCNARLANNGQMQQRDINLKRIRELQGRRRNDPNWGRKQWKKESGYHRRSLVETCMMRLKMLFGDKLNARNAKAQKHQALLRCHALNRMTHLGMPRSYAL
jgi:IS5 family transposase